AIEAAVPLGDRPEGGGDALRRGDVAKERLEPIAGGAQVPAQRGKPGPVAIEGHHRPAVIQQALRRSPPDAGCPSRDGCDPGHGGVRPCPRDGASTPDTSRTKAAEGARTLD